LQERTILTVCFAQDTSYHIFDKKINPIITSGELTPGVNTQVKPGLYILKGLAKKKPQYYLNCLKKAKYLFLNEN